VKKGQSVSLFIIIGILLLLVFALWQGMSGKEARRSFEREAAPSIEQVPTEARPVFEFITDCVRSTTKDAFVTLGDRGGYLDTSSLEVNAMDPTLSEGVQYHFASDLTIPYWYHMQKPNNCEKKGGCVFTSERPGLHEGSSAITIEEQVQEYVEENMPTCLRSFTDFKERGINVDVRKDPQADVVVTKNGVTAIVNMPVRIKSPSATHDYDLFVTDFPNFNFLDIYTLASTIAELQANYSFLEKQAMNLITLYSGIDAELPPVGATEFELGQGKFWIKKSVTRNIKQNILAPYVPMLQVYGTENYRPVFMGKEGGPISQSRNTLYNQGMLIPASMERTWPDLTANLQYLTIHEPYVDLNCDGQICQSTSGESDFVIPIGIKRYQFAYDLSYPVLVTIGNPAAFNNRGYQFTFAIEANLRDNKPLSSGYKFLIPPETKDVLDSDPFNAIDQRTSGMVTINVFNGYSRLSKIPKPAHDATVSFLCGDKKIQLGQVEDGVIKTRLPRCLSGMLEAKKFRGIADVEEINTMSDSDQEVNLTVYDSVPMNLTFKKIPLHRRVETTTSDIEEVTQMMIIWQVDNNTARVDLRDSEEVNLMLTRVPDYPGQKVFSIVSTIVGNVQTRTKYCDGGETGATNLKGPMTCWSCQNLRI
jgi:hypothetical protein